MNTRNNEHRASFVYYKDWAELLLTFPDELRLKIDDAVKRYVLYGEEPTDREVIYSMFGLMRTQIDRDTEKYDEICKKRGEAGKCHKGNQYTRPLGRLEQMEQMEQKSQVGTNGTDNDNDNDNENKEIPSKEGTKKADLSLSENPRFLKFNKALSAECPHVAKMEMQMSCVEFEKALKIFEDDSRAMWEMLRKMENRKDLEKKNRSVYLTLCNWKRREAGV